MNKQIGSASPKAQRFAPGGTIGSTRRDVE
jgi:hypothetical protein